MSNFRHVSANVEGAYKNLAALVHSALEAAGLPVHYTSVNSFFSGAEIGIDTGDDDAGGVYVKWRPSEQLSSAAAETVRQGKFSDPVIKHSGSIKLFMRDAIIAILMEAGFSVQASTDDMRPLAILVESGPKDAGHPLLAE